MNLAFIIRFATKEILSKRNYSLQIIFSLVIGVGAVTSINSYKTSLNQAILNESVDLMGGDLLIESNEKYTKEKIDFINSNLPAKTKKSTFVNFNSMIYNPLNKDTSLSSVRAVDLHFPLRGQLETEPSGVFENFGQSDILLEPNLAKNLNIQINDKVFLGKKIYRMVGTIKKEPGTTGNMLSLAPSSIIRIDSLPETGLEKRGSRIRYNILLKLPDQIDSKKFKETMFQKFIKNDMTLYHSTEIGSGTRRFISTTLDYMTLLGLCSLFLSTISILISVRANVKEKLGEIAILKCLGGNSSFYGTLFFLEMIILSVFGTSVGIAVGYFLQYAIPNLTGIDFLISIRPAITGKSLVYGFISGCMIPIIVTGETIFKAKTVSPMFALKNSEEFSKTKSPFFKVQFLGIVLIYIFFFILASIETESLFNGLLLSSTLSILPLLQYTAYRALKKITIISTKNFNLGTFSDFVLKKFFRPKNDYALSMIGLSSTMTILILSIIFRASLVSMGASEQNDSKANMFVLDIREEDKEQFVKLSLKNNVQNQIIAPVIGARLKSINFQLIAKEKTESDALKRDWRSTARTREYFLSYRDLLYDSEKLVSGNFWKNDGNEISVEQEFAKILSVGLNDTLQFNIQGIEVSGKITNLRTVTWADMKPNFVVIFSPNALENAPRYYISSFKIESLKERYEFQKKLTSNFPSATIVDIEKSAKNFIEILLKISKIIHLISVFIISSAFILFLASLYISKAQRVEETSLIRILGGNDSFIRKIYFTEGLLFSLYSFAISFLLSLFVEYFISNHFLKITSNIPYREILLLFFLSIILSTSIFLYHINSILQKPPKNFFQNQN